MTLEEKDGMLKYLSQNKYIYEVIYNSAQNKFQYLRHPIIYISKYYVYYKRHGCETLNTIAMSDILNENQLIIKAENFYYSFQKYTLIPVSNETKMILDELIRTKKYREYKNSINNLKHQIEVRKNEIERLEQQMTELENEEE